MKEKRIEGSENKLDVTYYFIMPDEFNDLKETLSERWRKIDTDKRRLSFDFIRLDSVLVETKEKSNLGILVTFNDHSGSFMSHTSTEEQFERMTRT